MSLNELKNIYPKLKSDAHYFMRYTCLLCDNSKCGYKVGCSLVKDDKIIAESWNEILPGLEKSNYETSTFWETESVLHAEAKLVGRFVKDGKSLDGLDLYVSTFPCINCAKLLTVTGIKTIYYMADFKGNIAKGILEKAGIKVVKLEQGQVWVK
ncbi:MAG: deaminase [bacterium]|nr:deaminase [bacterium]